MKDDLYRQLERTVAAWCRKRPDIHAAIVIGSRGRQDASPDRRADLDLILFCQQADSYQDSHEWLTAFGELWIATLNMVGPGHPEWLAFFAPGLKADFLFISASEHQSLATMLDALPYQHVLARGFRILYQSQSAASEPVATTARPGKPDLPSERAFQHQINATLFAAERFVKFSIRDDGWRSRYTFEAELKRHLLTLIEWHAQVGHEPDVDTWYEGRNLAAWADQRVVDVVTRLDAGHRLPLRQAALLDFLNLFQLLAGETAARLAYDFPTAGQRAMIAWLKESMQDPV